MSHLTTTLRRMLVSVSGAGALANVESVLTARHAVEADLADFESRVAALRPAPAVPAAA